jgi:hypothetical protein
LQPRSSLFPIRFLTLTLLLLALAVAGCGGSDDDDDGAAATTATSGTTTAPDDVQPFEDGTMAPVTGTATGTVTALLERVELGAHEDFDRIVFQFRNGVPGYRVEYVEPPLTEDGSGNPVELEGASLVVVRMEPASGFDLSVDEGEQVYTGPRRLSGADAGTSVITEAVRSGDFEAVLTWGVGLTAPVEYRVLTLQNPPRLVVDFRND